MLRQCLRAHSMVGGAIERRVAMSTMGNASRILMLNNLSDNPGAKTNRKRVGRGVGSGKGKTCGHGHKGQKPRRSTPIAGFEGGLCSAWLRTHCRAFSSVLPVSTFWWSVNETPNRWIALHVFSVCGCQDKRPSIAVCPSAVRTRTETVCRWQS